MSNFPGQPVYAPQQMQPQKKSGCFLKGLLGCCGVSVLLIIIACGGVMFFGRDFMKQNVLSDPVAVRAMSDEIVKFELPAGMKAASGIRLIVPIVNLNIGKMVFFRSADEAVANPDILMIFEVGEMGKNASQDELRQNIENNMGNNKQQVQTLKDAVTTTKNHKVNGKDASFQITEGIGTKSNDKRIQVQSTFQGKGNPAILIYQGSESRINKEKVEEMIDSME